MQNIDWNEKINKIRSWLNKHKRLVLPCGILALVIITLALWRPQKTTTRLPDSGVEVITRATQLVKEVNFQAEYDEQFSRKVNGVAEDHSYKLRESKKGTSWKKETFIDDLTLLEAFIRNDQSYFHCTTYPEISCVESAITSNDGSRSSRDASLSGFSLWEQKKIFQASVSQQNITVDSESRSATCVSYAFNPGSVSDEDVAALMNAIGGPAASSAGSASALREWLKQYDVDVCYDDLTGIMLGYHSVIRQSVSLENGGRMEYESEDTQTITRLRLNPLFSSDEFSTSSVR